MLFTSLVTFPSGTDLWDGVSSYADPTFTSLFLPVLYATGFIVGGMILAFIITIALGAIEMFFERLMNKFGMADTRGGVTKSTHTDSEGRVTHDTRAWLEKNY